MNTQKVYPLHLSYLMLSGANLIKGELIIPNLLSIKPWLYVLYNLPDVVLKD